MVILTKTPMLQLGDNSLENFYILKMSRYIYVLEKKFSIFEIEYMVLSQNIPEKDKIQNGFFKYGVEHAIKILRFLNQ